MNKLKNIIAYIIFFFFGISYIANGENIDWKNIEWNSDINLREALAGMNQTDAVNYISTHNQNSYYVSNFLYSQGLFNNLISGGGVHIPRDGESKDSTLDELFTNGTYDIYGGSMGTIGSGHNTVLANGTGNDTLAYGFNGFAQTGRVKGFSFGGAATAMNPFFASQLNGKNSEGYLTPTHRQIALTEAFAEYQFRNRLGVDVGYIGINNSPWLSPNFNIQTINTQMTYQGGVANLYAGDGWLLTGLAFNGAQPVGQVGFNGETLLNPKYNKTAISSDQSSQYTIGLGSSYKTLNNNYDLRLWAYQFENFGTIFYADNTLTLPLNSDVSFNFSMQGGIDNNLGMNTAYSNTTGNINSYFVGGEAGVSIDWFNLTLAGDTILGTPIVAPYVSALGTDPLYATGLLTNMVNFGLTGNAFQISPSVRFLDSKLMFTTNYVTLTNTTPMWSGTQEFYAMMNYFVPQVKGLQANTSLGYQWLPSANPEHDQWTGQLIVSYLW